MKKYVFATGAINYTNCVFRTPQRAIDEANDLSKATGVKVRVYEEIHLATPDAQSALRESISLAEKHLNDTIEEFSRTYRQVMADNLPAINKAVREIGKEILEGLRIFANTLKDTPASNVTTNRPFIHPDLLGERTEPTPYAKIQRRADFLDNFKGGWALFNSNALFRTIVMLVMNGASEYDLMLELIFMIDGHTTPGTSHLKTFHKQKPTDNETK